MCEMVINMHAIVTLSLANLLDVVWRIQCRRSLCKVDKICRWTENAGQP